MVGKPGGQAGGQAAAEARASRAPPGRLGGRGPGGGAGVRGGLGVAGGGVFPGRRARDRGPAAPPPATAAVARRDIAAKMPVSATLGYAGSWTVRGQGGGTLTRLPKAGQVTGQGQALYWVDNGSPVVLLYGRVPAWRALDEGVTGADVSQLNHDLVALGDAITFGDLLGGLGLLLRGNGVRSAEAGGASGRLLPAGVAVAGAGGVRACRAACRHRNGEPGRIGVRAGADRDMSTGTW